MGDPDKAEKAMESVSKYLDTDLVIKKIDPSMKDYPSAEDPLTYYNKGCGENGSVFCHANTWAIIAECMLGHPERAYKYYHQLLPMVAQEKAGELTGHDILRAVGIHAHEHERIRPEKSGV